MMYCTYADCIVSAGTALMLSKGYSCLEALATGKMCRALTRCLM